MNKKLLFIALIACLFASCIQNQSGRTEELIAGKEYKYWYMNDTNIYQDYFSGERIFRQKVYFFDRDKNFLEFSKNSRGNFSHNFNSCSNFSNKWSLNADNDTLFLNDYPKNILSLTDSVLIISYERSYPESKVCIDTLRAAPDTIVPIEYRKLR